MKDRDLNTPPQSTISMEDRDSKDQLQNAISMKDKDKGANTQSQNTISNLNQKTVPLHGGGATFPSSIYDAWIPVFQYERERFVHIDNDYKERGSYIGKQMVIQDPNGTAVAYGATDAILTKEERRQYPDLVAFPTVAG